jgi:hypothetical protein
VCLPKFSLSLTSNCCVCRSRYRLSLIAAFRIICSLPSVAALHYEKKELAIQNRHHRNLRATEELRLAGCAMQETEELPHWVALIGCSDDTWYVNNALAKSPGQRINRAKLENNLVIEMFSAQSLSANQACKQCSRSSESVVESALSTERFWAS